MKQALDTRTKLLTKSPWPLMLELSIPAVLGMVVVGLYNMMDSIFVGQLVGDVQMGAVSVSYPFTLINAGSAAMLGVGSAPGITVPFFQVVSGLPPASDFLHRFAKPPGHSFGYVPVESVDLRSLTKPARTEAAWIYLHNSDLPQSFAGYRLFVLWQSSICG